MPRDNPSVTDVFTGYELGGALEKYVEVGHQFDPFSLLAQPCRTTRSDEEEEEEEEDDKMVVTRETCRWYFKALCEQAPEEIQASNTLTVSKHLHPPQTCAALLIHYPVLYKNGVCKVFVATGWHSCMDYTSGALKHPSDADKAVIQDFIEAANSLLPDKAERRAHLDVKEMTFEVHSTMAVTAPWFYQDMDEACCLIYPTCHG
ncbi:hypothetical protein LXA43DRAFT_888205 [Ganoderma leucocontextum]|nr:hypothetical protein LXA43DRAFT_888205 [Ganoderma leucocontextum]